MKAKDWLKDIEKKLVIAQCMDHEKVLFAAHQLFGTAVNWWETYCNTHIDATPSCGMGSSLVSITTMYQAAP
jgi:hypothetical protein